MLVLVHGFMQDSTTWDEVSRLLATQRSAFPVTVNLRVRETAGTRMEDLVQIVDDCIELAREDRLTGGEEDNYLILAGYSMGGRVAIEYAHTFPDKVDVLVLESASLGPETPEERVRYEQRNLALAQRFRDAASMEEVVDFWESRSIFDTQKSLPAEVFAKQREMRLGCKQEDLAKLVYEAGVQNSALSNENLEFIDKAGIVLYYAAGAQDKKGMQNLELVQRYANETGATMFAQEFGCGHNIHLELPEQFARWVPCG